MKKYSCFVADKDNFPGMPHELLAAWQDEHQAVYIIDFDVPDGLEDRLVRLIAQGLLWNDGWTEAGTKSHIVQDLTLFGKRFATTLGRRDSRPAAEGR